MILLIQLNIMKEKILEAIDKAKVRLNANVNFDLTMELLFLTVRENLK